MIRAEKIRTENTPAHRGFGSASVTARALRSTNILVAALAILAVLAAPAAGDPLQSRQSSDAKAANRQVGLAVKLLNRKRYDEGIEILRDVVEKYPEEKVTEKAREFLGDFGVGEEVRIRLIDRTTFRKRFEILDPDVLKNAEKILTTLRTSYRPLTPHFTTHDLIVTIYESQALYRKDTTRIRYSGHFEIRALDNEKRTLQGEIFSFLPSHAASLHDRRLSMDSLLYHETTHYLNAIHFGATLPSVLDEGLATYFTSRLNTEYYQYFRQTDREALEASARNGLAMIKSYHNFEDLLAGKRGFGRGGVSIERWYGLCYAIVDFCARRLDKADGDVAPVLKALHELASEHNKKHARGRKRILPMPAESTFAALMKRLFELDPKAAHQAIVQHILTNYKQR